MDDLHSSLADFVASGLAGVNAEIRTRTFEAIRRAVAAERERCAKVIESHSGCDCQIPGGCYDTVCWDAAYLKKIREGVV